VNVKILQFPVIGFSPAGWIKEADAIHEFIEASPDDDLSDWQGLMIYDSSGLKYTARRVYRRWPSSRFGVWLCRLSEISVRVGMDLDAPSTASLYELRERVIAHYGELSSLREAVSHKELITLCL
jgi:hypothetical protein